LLFIYFRRQNFLRLQHNVQRFSLKHLQKIESNKSLSAKNDKEQQIQLRQAEKDYYELFEANAEREQSKFASVVAASGYYDQLTPFQALVMSSQLQTTAAAQVSVHEKLMSFEDKVRNEAAAKRAGDVRRKSESAIALGASAAAAVASANAVANASASASSSAAGFLDSGGGGGGTAGLSSSVAGLVANRHSFDRSSVASIASGDSSRKSRAIEELMRSSIKAPTSSSGNSVAFADVGDNEDDARADAAAAAAMGRTAASAMFSSVGSPEATRTGGGGDGDGGSRSTPGLAPGLTAKFVTNGLVTPVPLNVATPQHGGAGTGGGGGGGGASNTPGGAGRLGLGGGGSVHATPKSLKLSRKGLAAKFAEEDGSSSAGAASYSIKLMPSVAHGHTHIYRSWARRSLAHSAIHSAMSTCMERPHEVAADSIAFCRRLNQECRRTFEHVHALSGVLEVTPMQAVYLPEAKNPMLVRISYGDQVRTINVVTFC
jgi:hypothetical protein